MSSGPGTKLTRAVKPATAGAVFPNAKELCKLIATCKKHGVLSLKHGALELSFAATAIGPAIPNPQNVIEEQSKIQTDVLEREELSTREDQIAELLITDPLLAEELMELGELEKDDNGDESRD